MVAIDPTFLAVGLAILVRHCLRPLWGAVAFAAIGAVWLSQEVLAGDAG